MVRPTLFGICMLSHFGNPLLERWLKWLCSLKQDIGVFFSYSQRYTVGKVTPPQNPTKTQTPPPKQAYKIVSFFVPILTFTCKLLYIWATVVNSNSGFGNLCLSGSLFTYHLSHISICQFVHSLSYSLVSCVSSRTLIWVLLFH